MHPIFKPFWTQYETTITCGGFKCVVCFSLLRIPYVANFLRFGVLVQLFHAWRTLRCSLVHPGLVTWKRLNNVCNYYLTRHKLHMCTQRYSNI